MDTGGPDPLPPGKSQAAIVLPKNSGAVPSTPLRSNRTQEVQLLLEGGTPTVKYVDD